MEFSAPAQAWCANLVITWTTVRIFRLTSNLPQREWPAIRPGDTHRHRQHCRVQRSANFEYGNQNEDRWKHEKEVVNETRHTDARGECPLEIAAPFSAGPKRPEHTAAVT